MTNQHQAAQAIYHLVRNHLDIETELSKIAAIRIADTLQRAGLLAPDLPQPTNTLLDGSLLWELTTHWVLHVSLREGKIFLGDKQLHPLVVKELSLNLMAALHAAADYEEDAA